jgi:hypothetical protein
MKKIITLSFFLAMLFALPLPISAENICTTIESIAINVNQIEAGTPFTCKVTVDSAHAGSTFIGCGLSFNGAHPTDLCPSDEFFGGWKDNVAQFNCVFPNTNIPSTIDRIDLVAYDFRTKEKDQLQCGPPTGKSIPLYIKKIEGTPTQSPNDQTDEAREKLKKYFATPGHSLSQGIIDVTQRELLPSITVVIPHTSSPHPTPTPSLPVNKTFTTMRDVFEQVGCKVGVPPRVLEKVALIEYAPVFKLSAAQIEAATKNGGVMPNCPLNYCAAIGVMQMTIDHDERGDRSCRRCYPSAANPSCANQWATYGNAVTKYEDLPGYTPNACNIRDNVYAAALKLKRDSGSSKQVCGANAQQWSQNEVYAATRAYYGACVTNEGYGYCAEVWKYYNL